MATKKNAATNKSEDAALGSLCASAMGIAHAVRPGASDDDLCAAVQGKDLRLRDVAGALLVACLLDDEQRMELLRAMLNGMGLDAPTSPEAIRGLARGAALKARGLDK